MQTNFKVHLGFKAIAVSSIVCAILTQFVFVSLVAKNRFSPRKAVRFDYSRQLQTVTVLLTEAGGTLRTRQ